MASHRASSHAPDYVRGFLKLTFVVTVVVTTLYFLIPHWVI